MGRRLHPPGFSRRAAPGRPLPADRATAMSTPRLQHPLDRFLDETQRALETVFGNPPAARDNPAGDTPEVALDDAERRHAAGLMRINHVGEVCAQALYVGQAAVRSEEHTSELQSLMRLSYAVFCLQKQTPGH